MLIPSMVKRHVAQAVAQDAHPTMDYHALQAAWNADVLDHAALEAEGSPRLIRLARRGGRDLALAMFGYLRRNDYDIIYSNGENLSIPLALLLRRHRRRPLHVLIGHHLSTPKKRWFLRALHPQMDAVFVYASTQKRYGVEVLGIPEHRLHLIPFHADHRFYRPLPPSPDAPERMICSAGLEWRDYPTLIEAVQNLDVEVRLAAASPWSKHRNETQDRVLPGNVSARRYEYNELRRLYADARFVVVPLYQNDFQAGITTILEAMAMGKAVIATRTIGQVDTIRDGENGLYVPPGDPQALRQKIQWLLDHPEKAREIGVRARCDLEAGWTLDHWVERIVHITDSLYREREQPAASMQWRMRAQG